MAVDWFSMVMWFATLSSISMRMWTCGLVCPLFVAQTTWFGIPDFCNAEGEWVRHGVKDHQVHMVTAYNWVSGWWKSSSRV